VPATADYDNQATHKYMEKYLRTMDGVTGEARMKIFHLIRDISADQYGGWKKVTEQMVGGGLIAQRMNALDHYPIANVKRRRARWRNWTNARRRRPRGPGRRSSRRIGNRRSADELLPRRLPVFVSTGSSTGTNSP
jgi:4-hydroxyphenylacetate 3-hydroxylase C terminal